jgi:hypothetical protein
MANPNEIHEFSFNKILGSTNTNPINLDINIKDIQSIYVWGDFHVVAEVETVGQISGNSEVDYQKVVCRWSSRSGLLALAWDGYEESTITSPDSIVATTNPSPRLTISLANPPNSDTARITLTPTSSTNTRYFVRVRWFTFKGI